MTTYHQQACPLCGQAAEYCLVDADNVKYFHCTRCTYYQISVRAEKLVADRSAGRREGYAAAAPKAPPGQLLVIKLANHTEREASTDPLKVEYLPKSELSLS